MANQSRTTLLSFARLWQRALLLIGLLMTAPAWSANILLTAAEDSAGVQDFA
ncbi:ABC transporter substrate-binding protein, partial [Pseudomonas poae]|nr:ABC transporter substrate-binding protein [Pseudomonas poae]